MTGNRASTLLMLLWVVVLAGCATLQPLALPREQAHAPVAAGSWGELDRAAPGDWFVLLNEGPGALDWRLRTIDSATDSIDLQTFLWSFDTSGALVLDHLLAAADRGVRVRLLVDDTFLLAEDPALLALHRHPNLAYRVFNPYRRRADGFATRAFLNLAEFHRLDHRMHNKAMVVDGQVAIVGGRNLADEYFGLHGTANFRDMELIAGGPIVRTVARAFDDYWNNPWSFPIDRAAQLRAAEPQPVGPRTRREAGVPGVHREEPAAVRAMRWRELVAGATTGDARLLVDAPPGRDLSDRGYAATRLANELIALFDAAREEILIVSASLIPTPDLEGAVQRAVARGVRVRILTNSIRSNNHLAAHSAYRNHVETLLRHGAELHEVRVDARDRSHYMATPVGQKALALHAKTLVIDRDQVLIGSANLDPRSLRINTEMALLIDSEELNAQLRQALMRDFDTANAWRLEIGADGGVVWVSDRETLAAQPAAGFMQRIEDWFFALLPFEGEL
jgi:putative cardiolipin synthase